ncbi:MAG: ABC transporter ATP-binding protein [Cyclobacteriaceae bacterium]|nr:ABC transporter ATP-binding protein [Cyclobacteriaceae bacterium]
MTTAIQVDHISKGFTTGKEKVSAVKDVTFTVGKGELFGLVGPDGAGKTTLFRILTTLLLADSGSASVDGFDVVKDVQSIRKRVGYMPGKFSLYPDLTVAENLAFFATLFNTSLKENYDLVRAIYHQIEPFEKRKAGALSGGMKQKLALSCALIHRPSVLFLDEPTTGVDAVSRKEFWELLRGLQAAGISILVSTPYMDEASLCDRVALMQEGKIMDINSPQGITANFTKPLYAIRSRNMYELMRALQQHEAVESCYPFGQQHHVVFKDDRLRPDDIRTLVTPLAGDGLEVERIQPTIEDSFMDLMHQ